MVGADPLRSRLQAASVRGLTRFVGRDQRDGTAPSGARPSRRRAGAGRRRSSGSRVSGSRASSGSSADRHRTDGWRIVQAARSPTAGPRHICPIIDLLKGYFQIEDRDDPRKIREKVMGKLLALDRVDGAALPAPPRTVGRAGRGRPVAEPRPAQRRRRTLEAVKRLLLRESQVQPLLVVFEDLHWIDTETQAFLDSLVESLPTARLLLLVNYRPEYQHGWGEQDLLHASSASTRCRRRARASCSRPCSGPTPSSSPLSSLLIARTQGNPFFLEESVRALVETGVLAGERGAYRLARAGRRRRRAGHRPGGAGGTDRPAPAGGEGAPADGVRHREGCVRSRSCARSPTATRSKLRRAPG